MNEMKEFWSLNEGTFYCLYDNKRTAAFRKAIFNTIKKGDVVVEMGAGTGILSMFAADAGASKVYAVELDRENVDTLLQTLDENGYSEKVRVLMGDATKIRVPEKVDAIICEMIATGLIEELQIPAMNNALKYAKKNVNVILQRYDIFVDLVNNKEDFYNRRFKVIRYEFPDKTSLRSKPLSDKTLLKKIDFRKTTKNAYIKRRMRIMIKKSGQLNGIRISSNSIFSDASVLDHSLSYSFPIILPIETTAVRKGDEFRVTISYSMCEGPHRLKYSISRQSC